MTRSPKSILDAPRDPPPRRPRPGLPSRRGDEVDPPGRADPPRRVRRRVAHWDPYPFILLNLAFSTQAAYAAPLILLAQTRQADRDKHEAVRTERRQSALEHGIKRETDRLITLLESNTTLTQQDKELTEQVARLTQEMHAVLMAAKPDPTE